MAIETAITGFPRIGENRELKRALESYWSGRTSKQDLRSVASELRRRHWLLQKESGIDLISSNDFSLYDIMLDTAVMLGAVPQRFRNIEDATERYFAMARGAEDAVAMEMTKWFNTNYHYIVPELDPSQTFSLNAEKIISEYREAKELGIAAKINVIGPITFLALSKTSDGSDPLDLFDGVLAAYCDLVEAVGALDEEVAIQFEEPIFVRGADQRMLELLRRAYSDLPAVSEGVRVIVTTYFEHSNEATAVLAETPVWGLGLDFVHGPDNVDGLRHLRGKGKTLLAGVVDGRNIWAADLEQSLAMLERASDFVGENSLIASTSCSLLHTPFSTANEPASEVRDWMAFAVEKVAEVALIGSLFGDDSEDTRRIVSENRRLLDARTARPDTAVAARVAEAAGRERAGAFPERIGLQHQQLQLPDLPTTTIGSFPQTPELRRMRRDFKKGEISAAEYQTGIRAYIDDCIAFQEQIGLDVLVHGEPERNDMVEYFGEMLKGFHFTRNGWVQSYGSRCVKPPVIYGDVSRPQAMTVEWIAYAQSQTERVVKGMLTGPVTILNWSFVRNDIPRADVSRQIAVALSDEIDDLQRAGIKIIQVDEAAFKEGYPLRAENIPEYERWALASFKAAVASAWKQTQIHTHMCYSEFNDVIETIEAMDADVITIETARSGNELLHVFSESGYANEIGPGVYDIHSPRIPSVAEFEREIRLRLEVLERGKMWVNPDCGLKTRKWEEVRPALANMVAATVALR